MDQQHKRYMWIAIGILALLLIVFSILLIRQYQHVQRLETFNQERNEFTTLFHRRTLTVADVSYIQSWMTFDYVGVLFKVPNEYLKTTLNITSPLYPRVTIGRYAKSISTTTQAYTTLVQDAVRAYLSDQSTTTASTTTSSR